VTSGGYSPALGVNIGLGYVPIEISAIGSEIEILIRDKLVPAHIVNRKFYTKGRVNEPERIQIHQGA